MAYTLVYVIFFLYLCSDFRAKGREGCINNKKRDTIMANERQQSGALFNALTAGSKIVGNITADSDYRIDGLIEGELQCSGKVVIGEVGRIKGSIVCQNAEILGLLEGKITCREQLSLRTSGKIMGDVITKTLIVEPGAMFNGTCSMGGATVAEKKA